MKFLSAVAFIVVTASSTRAQTGVETEDRFPPLELPPGFESTLFACDPLVEYPSVIALGPKPGTLFVVHDYMTGLGREIVRRDEIRLIEDTDGDGYADKSTLFAGGFNSIQGLEFFDGEVFAMHSPFLTRMRDTDGDGVADERHDLLTGLGLPPEDNEVRLHCANGVTAGFDGWLYLAIGDHGVEVPRSDGSRLVHHGGGILRCRRDGSELHVFATGTRNIYDVALDADLNVFIRDNENDGGSFKIRVSHSFLGANHGYPYLFRERPEELLTPLADLGLGSSAGGACYLETAFPAEYRGNTFFAEWGKSIVRHRLEPRGSSFAPIEMEHEFAVGNDSDTYPFKPTDVVVDRDGSLLVSDWADGQRPKRGRARIYRIRYVNGEQSENPISDEAVAARLDSPSWHVRVAAQLEVQQSQAEIDLSALGTLGRIHAVWILADTDKRDGSGRRRLLELAATDGEPRVRAQAVRALGDLGVVGGLPQLGTTESDPRVLREIVIALGRTRWEGLADWLREAMTDPDPALAHAAKQMLHSNDNYAAILGLLDLETDHPARSIALQAVAERFDTELVGGVISRLQSESSPVRQRQLADLLTRVHRRPAPWVYWEYRPAPRTPNPVDWEKSVTIEAALNTVLKGGEFETRHFVLQRMRREQVPVQLAALEAWLESDHSPQRAAAILRAIANHPPNRTQALLERTVREMNQSTEVRLDALRLLIDRGQADLGKFATTLRDDAVLAEILLQPGAADASVLSGKLDSDEPQVRAAAIRSLGRIGQQDARDAALRLLGDEDVAVRAAAAAAAGDLRIADATEQLLGFAAEGNGALLQRESLDALRKLGEARAIPVTLENLANPDTRLTALRLLGEIGQPDHAAAVVDSVAAVSDSEVLQAAATILDRWSARDAAPDVDTRIANLHGRSGQLLRWKGHGVSDLETARSRAANGDAIETATSSLAGGTNSMVQTEHAGIWTGSAEIEMEKATNVQFLASSNGSLELWLNGERIHSRQEPGAFRPDSDRAGGRLKAGRNTLTVIVSANEPVHFHVRFRHSSSRAEQEQLIQYVLSRPGDVQFGRELFFDTEISQCAICHRIDGEGGRIGPDLSGAGGRFSQIYLIESILEPSRALAPSYQSHLVSMEDGRTFFGVKVGEDSESITIGDLAGKHHRLSKTGIASQEQQPVSLMPPGLETRMTPKQFADLLAFLLAQK